MQKKNYYFNWKHIRCTMILITKTHIPKLFLTIKIVNYKIMKNNINLGLVPFAVVTPVNSWRTGLSHFIPCFA